MDFARKLLNEFNGLHYQQEYLCLAIESLDRPLHAYHVRGDRVLKDVTELHLFVGYSPLIFALSGSTLLPGTSLPVIDLAFTQNSFYPNELLKAKDAIATLSLKEIHRSGEAGKAIHFFEGIGGGHRFVSRFHQWVIGLNNNLYNRKQGNVFLENELYQQVQVAYAIPRKISLITVCEDGLFNLFPTDLHGRIDDDYVISLRRGGKACAQVESAGKILLSDVSAGAYKEAYALGKNHMQPLRERSFFEFSPNLSRNFSLPLPKDALCYKELDLVDSFPHGIHNLLRFRIVDEEKTGGHEGTLSHIHNCYATWRHKHRISSNLLLR